ncbi:hypothetical protein JTE90_014666 [Oedothorax gibbosus]|uniref:Uncharacterized protein n=1 Tax=Oedothorax gibbosus TaxID=931172 RepID=A0AAV6VAB1_9ARAC|nr:hypothetical protein JTE90_014666 [Oedothorax gibbosus]
MAFRCITGPSRYPAINRYAPSDLSGRLRNRADPHLTPTLSPKDRPWVETPLLGPHPFRILFLEKKRIEKNAHFGSSCSHKGGGGVAKKPLLQQWRFRTSFSIVAMTLGIRTFYLSPASALLTIL